MDKSMLPIIIALIAVVAAGAVLAISGETSDKGEMSSGGALPPSGPDGMLIPTLLTPGPSFVAEADLVLAPGEERTISVPSEYLPYIAWGSSDPSVCTVSVDLAKGTATATGYKVGECDLTATLLSMTAACHVTVK